MYHFLRIFAVAVVLFVFALQVAAVDWQYYAGKAQDDGTKEKGGSQKPRPGRYQSGRKKTNDPISILEKWEAVESRLKDKVISPKDQRILDEQRQEKTRRIAEKVVEYVKNFNLKKLRNVCQEIRRRGDSIPYLKKTKLMRFAQEFGEWDRNFDVKVTASIEPNITDSSGKCKEVKVLYSKLKRKNVDGWEHGNPVQVMVDDPEIEVEYLVGCQSIYKFPRPNGDRESARYYFNPARDEAGECTTGRFGKGYTITYKFETYSKADNLFPVRLSDFLKNRFGGVEELCAEDN